MQVMQTSSAGGPPGDSMITAAVTKFKSFTSSGSPNSGPVHMISGQPPPGSWVQVPPNNMGGPQQVMVASPAPQQMMTTTTYVAAWTPGPGMIPVLFSG